MEKDGLLDTVSEITDEFDVPIVAQPFTSISNQHDAANRIMTALDEGKKAVVYHLGDYDPSGNTMFTAICRDLPAMLRNLLDCPEEWIDGDHDWSEDTQMVHKPREEGKGIDLCIRGSDFCNPKVKRIRWASPKLTIERLGLIRSTVDAHCQYAVRPTKRKNNTHAQRFPDDESCELDALPPNVLRSLVRRAIERHIPKALVEKVRAKQAKEQKKLLKIAADNE